MTTENDYGYDYTSAPTTDYFGGSFDYGMFDTSYGGGSDFFAYFKPDTYGEGTPGATASWTGGGAAVPSGGNPIMDILGNASKWFGELKPQTQSSLIALGGSFLAGAMGAKNKDQIAKNGKMTAEASMMNAQSAAKLADSKVAMQQKTQMSGTNFGKPRPGGIMSLPYKNKLAERQANPGGSGLIGAA